MQNGRMVIRLMESFMFNEDSAKLVLRYLMLLS